MVKFSVANCHLFNGRSSVLRSLCTSVEMNMELEDKAPEKHMATGGEKLTLYHRLCALGPKKGYVAQTINEHAKDGRAARKKVLERCFNQLRRIGKPHLALEILEYMEKRKINFGFATHFGCMGLVAKVHGIAAAENYFDGLSPSEKNVLTYRALLHCYCRANMAEKAWNIFKKIDEMERNHSSFTFSNMMSLYMRLGQPEKVPLLVLDMKKRGIRLSTFTYNIWMSSYSLLNDIQGVERVFEEIMKDRGTECEETTYSNLVDAYVKAGLSEKAELFLKEFEQTIKARSRPTHEEYRLLITLYAKISKHGEVDSIWKSLKSASSNQIITVNYLTMIQTLINLKDIEGMKKCFEEWEVEWELLRSEYDIRVVNLVLDAYLKHDMIEEAKTTLYRARERSECPFSIAWNMLTKHYLNKGQIEQVFECLEAAGSEWYPTSKYVGKFLSYFKEEKDPDGAKKFCEYVRKRKPLDSDDYKMLLETYIAAGRTTTCMRKRIEEDGVELSLELENLLQKACPEFWISSFVAKLSKPGRFYGSSIKSTTTTTNP